MPSKVKRDRNDPNNPYRVGQTNEKGHQICGAKKRDNGVCQSTKIMRNERCRVHGGATPSGFLYSGSKSGKYFKYLPKNLGDRYQEFLDSPDLLGMRDEIAVTKARYAELAERVGEDADAGTWKDMQKLWGKFIVAVRTGDQDEQSRLIYELDQLVELGARRAANWKDMSETAELLRKMTETEVRKMHQARQYISVEDAVLLMTHLVSQLKDIVNQHAEPHVARKIVAAAGRTHTELAGLTNGNGADSVTVDARR